MATQGVLPDIWLSFILVLTMTALLSAPWLMAQVPTDTDLSIMVNSSDVRADFHHFWKSTGFCPPQPHQDASFDLSSDMVQNLAYIGALPFNGITQVRIHWLLDLVRVSRVSSVGPVYSFSLLDSLVKLMHENGLAFGFELMGSPSGIFSNFENRTQVFWFRDLVTVLATRYIHLYGLSYVQKWNFETWNEPDCHDFDKMKFSVQGFLNYYDACSEGLEAAHPSLVLGGPGDACWPDPDWGKLTRSRVLFDALLNHTIRGINYFTGKKGVRINFISLHEKGDGQALKILEKEISASKYLNSKFPELADKPFYNDEADLLVGWSRPLEWRASAEYAALVAKVIVQHQNILSARRGASTKRYLRNYALLSNDNAFLSYYPNQFTQRTLLARFQINKTSSEPTITESESIHGVVRAGDDAKEKSTLTGPVKESYVTFVRKSVYILMGMLPLLGDKQIYVNVTANATHSLGNTSDFGVVGTVHDPPYRANTSESWQVTVLVYGSSDPGTRKHRALGGVKWYIEPPKQVTDLKYMMYNIWKYWGDPYAMWKIAFNSTKYPTLDQMAQLRGFENPQGVLIDVPVKQGFAPILPPFALQNPGIYIFHLCAKPPVAPEKVVNVRVINITAGQVLVVWSDERIHTKCIFTYSVEWSALGANGPFKRLNKYNTIFNAYPHETDSEDKVQGYYRVRAIDYWRRKGTVSDVVSYKTAG
ncbi:hypothetical protein EGW08_002040 [Elysia chlorotica]|uniref:Alpha-L-iduronidase n=1 Tax=Elysia chlorotica TaxID=188477 RepID=A0A3S0ZZV2_ELYCH|nr:hypothetical protein EGW08_002040 [Elysia chlorotica]